MPVSYLSRPKVDYFHRRRWFTKPKFYIPIGAALVALLGFGIYFSYLAKALSAEAETFELRLNSPLATTVLATHSLTVGGLALTAVCAPTARRRQVALKALAVLLGRPPRPRD